MTTDIKAAIAGAIEALEFYRDMNNYLADMYKDRPGFNFKETPVHNDGGEKARDALTALRRIEFVEPPRYPDHPNAAVSHHCKGWNNALDHLTTTGHAIIKMGE